MATLIECGLIVTGVSVAIVVVVSGWGSKVNTTFTNKSAPVVNYTPPKPNFDANEMGWKKLIESGKENSRVRGLKTYIVDVGRGVREEKMAISTCAEPLVEDDRAFVAWFTTGQGERGYFIPCK